MRHLLKYTAFLLAVGLISWAVLPAGLAKKAEDKYPSIEKPKHKSYTETIPGTKVKFEMVAIPSGKYMRGSPVSEKGRDKNEGPQHLVEIKPIWIGKLEVTWDEFDTYWRGRPGKKEDKEPEKPKDADAVTRPTPPYADETFGLGREGFPVICITHHCALQYCRWLSVKTGKVYRLPTEAEWEWACRGGTTTKYSFGDDEKHLGDHAWYAANSDDKPQKVGKKKPNAFGLYDMHGNVAEWCIDQYDAKAYDKYPTDKLTLRPFIKPGTDRFPHPVRGGSWADEANLCRSASRRGSNKEWITLDPNRPKSIWWLTSAEFVGLRVVRAVEEQPELKGFRSTVTRESK